MSRWPLSRLKFLASAPIKNGLGEKGEFDDPSWPRYIRTTDIASPTSLRDDTFKSLPFAVAKDAMLSSGDILMTAAGATIGKSFRFTDSYPACFAGYLVRFRPDEHKVNGRFVAYWMQSATYWAQVDAQRVKSTIENFSASRYQGLEVPVPPLPTQRAIADYLDTETARIDALIEKKRRMVALLEERRMSAMTEGVSGQMTEDATRPSTLPWISECGATWKEARLTLVARQGTGHTPSREHPEWWVDCNIPWITTGEVAQVRSDRVEVIDETREKISLLGTANSSAEVHPAGTVVLCRTASAGYSAIMGSDMATSQDFATWTCGPLLRPRFLLLCLRAMRQDLLGRLAMGSTHKTIYMPDIGALRIPLPDTDTQDRIIDVVEKALGYVNATTDVLARQIDLLVERRQALITAAVTGELTIPGVAA